MHQCCLATSFILILLMHSSAVLASNINLKQDITPFCIQSILFLSHLFLNCIHYPRSHLPLYHGPDQFSTPLDVASIQGPLSTAALINVSWMDRGWANKGLGHSTRFFHLQHCSKRWGQARCARVYAYSTAALQPPKLRTAFTNINHSSIWQYRHRALL